MEIQVAFHQVHQRLHCVHVNRIHLYISALDMFEIEFFEFLKKLNEFFSPGLVGIFIEIHFHHIRIEVVVDLNHLFFTVPHLDSSRIRYVVGHPVYRKLLAFLEKHCTDILLFIGLGFLARDFEYLNHIEEFFKIVGPVSGNVFGSSIEDTTFFLDYLASFYHESFHGLPLLTVLPVVVGFSYLLGRLLLSGRHFYYYS